MEHQSIVGTSTETILETFQTIFASFSNVAAISLMGQYPPDLLDTIQHGLQGVRWAASWYQQLLIGTIRNLRPKRISKLEASLRDGVLKASLER